MVCKSCNQEIEENSKFCPNCGEKIKEEIKEAEIVEVIEEKEAEPTEAKETEIVEEVKEEKIEEAPVEIIKCEEPKQDNTEPTVKKAEVVQEEEKGLSIASLVLGICSILFVFEHGILNLICAILAIIFGVKGRKKGAKGMGTAGMVLGIISLVLMVIVLITIAMIASAVFMGIALNA